MEPSKKSSSRDLQTLLSAVDLVVKNAGSPQEALIIFGNEKFMSTQGPLPALKFYSFSWNSIDDVKKTVKKILDDTNKLPQRYYDEKYDALVKWLKKCASSVGSEQLFKKVKVPSAKPDDVFGRWAFATKRPRELGIPKEMDTDLELKVYDTLKSHFFYSGPEGAIGDLEAQTLKSVLNDKLYRDMIVPAPVGTKIYRGMKVTDDWLRMALGLSKNDKLEKSGTAEAARFILKPMHGVATSWSLDRKYAQEFSMNTQKGPKGKARRVVLVAIVDDDTNFLDCSSFYEMDSFEKYEREKEIIALKPVTVKEIYWSPSFERVVSRG